MFFVKELTFFSKSRMLKINKARAGATITPYALADLGKSLELTLKPWYIWGEGAQQ